MGRASRPGDTLNCPVNVKDVCDIQGNTDSNLCRGQNQPTGTVF